MNKNTKTILIVGGVALGVYFLTRPSGSTFLGTSKVTNTGSVWDKAGSFLGSTFKSWFGNTADNDTTYTPNIARGQDGAIASSSVE